MTFETRIAKIGKGINTNLYLNNDNNLSIFFYTNSNQEKVLKIDDEKYALNTTENVFGYEEVIKVYNNFYVVRQGNIIKVLNV